MLTEPLRLQRMGEAKRLFASTLRLAEQEKVFGAEIDLLNQEGQIASKSGDLNEAEQAFLKAASVGRASELTGLEAAARALVFANASAAESIRKPQPGPAKKSRGLMKLSSG